MRRADLYGMRHRRESLRNMIPSLSREVRDDAEEPPCSAGARSRGAVVTDSRTCFAAKTDSAVYYPHFVDLLSNADPELRPTVAEAHKRIEQLNRARRRGAGERA